MGLAGLFDNTWEPPAGLYWIRRLHMDRVVELDGYLEHKYFPADRTVGILRLVELWKASLAVGRRTRSIVACIVIPRLFVPILLIGEILFVLHGVRRV